MQDVFKLVAVTADTRGNGAFPQHRKEHRMSLKIGTSIWRALRVERTAQMEDVHFHSGVDGRVYPCDFARCDSPQVTPREIGYSR
jgi:hypothetical protein